MKRSIKSLLAALVVSLSLAAPVLAGPYEDGLAAADRKDYTTALRLWRPLAEQGNSSAQFNLGVMYDNGKGVPQDYVKARVWFRKAAEHGDVEAQSSLEPSPERAVGVRRVVRGRGFPGADGPHRLVRDQEPSVVTQPCLL